MFSRFLVFYNGGHVVFLIVALGMCFAGELSAMGGVMGMIISEGNWNLELRSNCRGYFHTGLSLPGCEEVGIGTDCWSLLVNEPTAKQNHPPEGGFATHRAHLNYCPRFTF